MPAATPAEVSTSPSSTKSTSGSSRTCGNSAAEPRRRRPSGWWPGGRRAARRRRARTRRCRSRPSGRPVARPRASAAVSGRSSGTPSVDGASPWMPGTITVSAVVEQLRAVVGQRPGSPPRCAPARRRRCTIAHVVERVARSAVRAAAEDLRAGCRGRTPTTASQGEHGDAVRDWRAWPILAHDGRLATRRGTHDVRTRDLPTTRVRRTSDADSRQRVHPAWLVAAVAFVALVGAAGFRATPGVLIDPLHDEFGWSLGTISAAVSVNLVLYGLTAPFAAALMDRFGIRRVVAVRAAAGRARQRADRLHDRELAADPAAGACWSASAPARWRWRFVATVTGRWFVERRGLVTGVLTAGGATGQLVFLPLLAALARATTAGGRRRSPSPAAALAVVPLVVLAAARPPGATWACRAYGGDRGRRRPPPRPAGAGAPGRRRAAPTPPGPGRSGCWPAASRSAARRPTAWSAPTSSRPRTTTACRRRRRPACSPWSASSTSSAPSPRAGSPTGSTRGSCSAAYYALRGVSLLVLPGAVRRDRRSRACSSSSSSTGWTGWPRCRRRSRCAASTSARPAPIVFGWVFASHQIGAAVAAIGAGLVRDQLGDYDLAWYVAGALSIAAAGALDAAAAAAATPPDPSRSRPAGGPGARADQ